MFLPTEHANFYARKYGHAIIYGMNTDSGMTTGPALTPHEAFALDQKFDDSKPGFGNIMAPKSPLNPNCTTTNIATTTAYRSDIQQNACSLIFITGY